MIQRAEGKGKELRIAPPLVETSDVTPLPCGVKTYIIVGEGKPRQLFCQTHVCLCNYSAQPSTHRASSIRSTHSKYNPSRALADCFCLFSTNIVAFRNCLLLNWSASTSTTKFDMKHITPDMTEADIILPTIHFSKHLNYNLEWHCGHVERRKEDQHQWTTQEAANVAVDKLGG